MNLGIIEIGKNLSNEFSKIFFTINNINISYLNVDSKNDNLVLKNNKEINLEFFLSKIDNLIIYFDSNKEQTFLEIIYKIVLLSKNVFIISNKLLTFNTTNKLIKLLHESKIRIWFYLISNYNYLLNNFVFNTNNNFLVKITIKETNYYLETDIDKETLFINSLFNKYYIIKKNNFVFENNLKNNIYFFKQLFFSNNSSIIIEKKSHCLTNFFEIEFFQEETKQTISFQNKNIGNYNLFNNNKTNISKQIEILQSEKLLYNEVNNFLNNENNINSITISDLKQILFLDL